MSNHVYILLPVHNRREISVRCAATLQRQSCRGFTLVLIDDGSTDGTAEAVQAVLPDTVVVRGNGTWWWAGSMAAGCRWLHRQQVPGTAVVALLNDDVEFGSSFLDDALNELAAHPGTLLLARQLDAATGEVMDAGGGLHANLWQLRFEPIAIPERINCLPARGLFLRWRDLERSGGFRPERLPHYLADYEFSIRAHRRGLKLRVSDRVAIRTRFGDTGLTRSSVLCQPRLRRIRMLFSRRFKENPQAWITFAWLTAPWPARPWLTLKVCARTLVLGAKYLIAPVPRDVSQEGRENSATSGRRR